MRTSLRTAGTLAALCLVNLLSGIVLTSPAYAGDGIGSDSGPSMSCSSGFYYCWSNAQQKSVCTTRKCYYY